MSNNKYPRPRDNDDFDVAIFCALPLEAVAMTAVFDEIWQEVEYGKCDSDTNSYSFGRIHQHPVVLVHMPRIGKAAAASAGTNLRSIRMGLLVGICGGVPLYGSGNRETMLGDVIISTHVVQSDFGRLNTDRFTRKNTIQDNLGRPNQEIGGFLSKLQEAQTNIKGSMRLELDESGNYPGTTEDKLFEASYRHKHADSKACVVCSRCINPGDAVCNEALQMSCTKLGCDFSQVVSRARIQAIDAEGDSAQTYCPEIHFGGLGSGDQVIKYGLHRDHIAKEEDVIGFEMEGAGLWDTIPTIVVKGVCDYADSHKNKKWQSYAATTAAACTKGILKEWVGRRVDDRLGDKEPDPSAPSPVHQVFSGSFYAGKNMINGGNFNGGNTF
ncbi:hypothetical protein N7495_008304 [Penicillium taxi]|uniref:uncharacterized protein n=1 Tax=Penicillium taxi TaxID=168475 RepID=UPI0025459742|nr:uncharacterized protein N7495_008304 [Penicillium taxi]KAJ5888263.1 hypothetical protein N7495_008304 [Penicillium taxi]